MNLTIWKNHMERSMNMDNEWGDCVKHAMVENLVAMIELEEVKTALKHSKNGKTSGPTDVVV